MTHARLAQSKELSGFISSLQESRTPHISPKRLSQALRVKLTNLARLTGVHRNTLRNPSSERLQGRTREVVKVISAATECIRAVDKAIHWYRNELIADYDRRTAAELVADGQVEAVPAFIRNLENGARDESRPRREGWDCPLQRLCALQCSSHRLNKSSQYKNDIRVASPDPTDHYRDS